MVVRGRIVNGVVVFQADVSLPEGAEVSVVVQEPADGANARMTTEQHRRYKEALTAIDSLPSENPGDTFRGADHDEVLYGERK